MKKGKEGQGSVFQITGCAETARYVFAKSTGRMSDENVARHSQYSRKKSASGETKETGPDRKLLAAPCRSYV
ncbi:MAG: hypothetical protein LBH60_00605 [Prevotellaceae bacterium]|jgi:hypothetical protein|nr:hypothetical protein [Prevotellaceae bacterium]